MVISKKNIMGIAVAATLAIGSIAGMSGCASCSRFGKSLESDISGGMERKVTVYSNTGEVIYEDEGKIDLQVSEEGGHVVYDKDGKRTVITGGIVISEEM